LSEEQRITWLDANGWLVKDHLGHLTAWERGTVFLLKKQSRPDGLGIVEATFLNHDGDELNALLHLRTKDRSLHDVLVDFRQVHQDLRTTLDQFTYADLLKTYSDYQPDEPGEDDGTPIPAWVAGIANHYDEHRGWIEWREHSLVCRGRR
jgi:hypothetical protein